MIRGFKDQRTEALLRRRSGRGFPPEVRLRALRKLTMLHAAATLTDLRSPPGNRLERLAGDRAGQWSIRVNDQYRICFVWDDRHAYDVELTDYH
jgi:proteic killer suppression protein